MSNTLFYRPGELGTLVIETYSPSTEGLRVDGYQIPYIDKIYLPKNSDGYILSTDGYALSIDGYSSSFVFTRLETGLYLYNFKLPIGGSKIGTYLFDVRFWNTNVENEIKKKQITVISQSVSGNIGLKSSS